MSNVLQVAPSVALDQGGPSVFAVRVHEALRSVGTNATLVTTDWASGSSKLPPDAVGAFAPSVVVASGSWPSRLRNSRQLKRELDERVRDSYIVHVDGFYLSSMWQARSAARRYGIPYVLMPHGNFEPFQRAQSRTVKEVYDLAVGRRIRYDASGYVFTAESELDGATPLLRPGVPTKIVSLGAARTEPTPIPEMEQWLSGVPRERVVLFLGRLAGKKQPRLLVEAWGRLPHEARDASRLVIAGPDDEHSAAELRDMVTSLALTKTVRLLGPVTQHQASWLYGRAAIFTLPTLNENFGMTIAEAMLHGCSVLTTLAAAASAHVTSADGGLVLEAATPENLAHSLNDMLTQPSMTAAAGARSAAYAERKLTWKNTANELNTFYDEAAAFHRAQVQRGQA